MLSHIFIRDFAIIEKLDLPLESGMTVLTGETGAGKSILIDAIGLVLGDRANSHTVRQGASKAEIILVIDIQQTPAALEWLQQQDLDNGEECIIRRIIAAKGKSRSWINGSPSTLTMLKQLGELIVDIHGQHEHQSLMKKDHQRQLLDDFADNHALLTKLKHSAALISTTNTQYQNLINQSEEQKEKLALLRFQVTELEQLNLIEGEPDALDNEYQRLANTEQLLQVTHQVQEQLYTDENSVYSQLSTLNQSLKQQIVFDKGLKVPFDLLSSAQILVQEAAEECRHYSDGLTLDPQRLQEVEQRINDLQNIANKYQCYPNDLAERLSDLHQQVEGLDSSSSKIETLQRQRHEQQQAYLQQANKLTKRRQQAAKQLSKQVSQAMQSLSMEGGIFEVGLDSLKNESYSANGLELIRFLVSANPGQPTKPLVDVASGGELSRISLAIQMIAAQKVTLPALIFDEVDSGIGGATAEVVGQQLRKLGDDRQVLCVTHLPQVASKGHNHYKVTKIKQANSTSTGMISLDQEARVEEIARMIGGVAITTSTLSLAKEMIANS
ncbi:MAG: DNA repair protein RecN [Thiotrichaceae bacterium]|nr:DNA repair protein RecN [Thiotrichaceae bacterium]